MDPSQCWKRSDGIWVCGECAFAYDRAPDELLRNLQEAPRLMAEALDGLDRAIVDEPPLPGLWTRRQYAAHLADWAEIIRSRVDRMLTEDAPLIEDIDQDVLVSEHGYDQWDIRESVDRYETAVRHLASRLTGEPIASWERVGIRAALGEPQPLKLYVLDLVHEIEHHLSHLAGVP